MIYKECIKEGCGIKQKARQLCHKHYYEALILEAEPCTITDCTRPASRRDLCDIHYRKQLSSEKPRCSVTGCGEPKLVRGLCDKHRKRADRHGSVNQTRSEDWGSRTSHPLYETWHWHKQRTMGGICQEWKDDFWLFIKTVGERPANHTLRKLDPKLPLNPSNWFWKDKVISKTKAEYARKWRSNNPRLVKNAYLMKNYGITIEVYEAMFEAQNGLCAICKQMETAVRNDGSPQVLSVDHCHTTNEVRALLCKHCNIALGEFKDNITYLKSAIQYLIKHT